MDEILETIDYSLRFRMYDNALLLCHEFFSRSPIPMKSTFLHFYARAYMESGYPALASILLREYEQFIDGNPEIILLYAQSYFESGNYSAAESILKRYDVMEILNVPDPKLQKYLLISYNYLLGTIKMRTHRHVFSQENFNKCLNQNRYMISAMSYAGKESLDQLSNSVNNSQTTILKPSESSVTIVSPTPATTSSTFTFFSRQQPSKPEISITELTLLNPDFDPSKDIQNNYEDLLMVKKSVAMYYFKRSKYVESANAFKRLFELYPYCIDGVDIYSTVLWQLKDSLTLTNLVNNSISIAPNCPEPWIAFGNLLSLQQQTDKAIKMFERAANISKKCSYALALAGHEYLLSEMLKESENSFVNAIARNPFEWSAWYGLGEVKFRQDSFMSAEYYIHKALELNPYSSILCFIYGTVLRSCGKQEESMEMFNKALELDPTNVVAIYEKGMTLYNLGKLEEAQECLSKTGSYSIHEPAISFAQGKIAQQLGDFKNSLFYFVDALIKGYSDKKDISLNVEGMVDSLVNEIIEDDSNDDPQNSKENEKNDDFNAKKNDKDKDKDDEYDDIEIENNEEEDII